MEQLQISEQEQGQRLDKFLLKYLNKAPKSFIYKMLRKKNIKYNSKKAQGNEIIQKDDIINIFLSDDTINGLKEEKHINKTNFQFDIIYEDQNIIICNKPAGLIVHPDKNNSKDTLNDQLLYYLYQKGEFDINKNSTFTPSICNRLDRNTSGIVIMGKNLASVQELNEIFRCNKIDKFYLTIVKGVIKKNGIFNLHHLKSDDNIVKVCDYPIEGSKNIITEYFPIRNNGKFTLVNIKLITGKSHQIRASFFYKGFPIIGDRKYGDKNINKYFEEKYKLKYQFLHSYKVIFNQSNGILNYLHQKEFTADLNSKILDNFDNI